MLKIESLSENNTSLEEIDESDIPIFENNQTEDDLPF